MRNFPYRKPMKRISILMICVLCLISVSYTPVFASATYSRSGNGLSDVTPGMIKSCYTVSSAKELNRVFGGGHRVTGNTITLKRNVTVHKQINLVGHIQLKLNGKSVCTKAHYMFFLPDVKKNGQRPSLSIYGKGKLTGRKESLLGIIYSYNGAVSINKDAAVYGDIFTYKKDSRFVINRGIVHGTVTCGRGSVTVNGGILRGINEPGDYLFKKGEGVVDINDGSIQTVYAEQGTVNVRGGQITKLLASDLEPCPKYTTKINMSGGKVSGRCRVGEINITGGEINITDKSSDYLSCAGKMTMSGGVINGGKLAVAAYILDLSGGTINGSAEIVAFTMEFGDIILSAVPPVSTISGGRIIQSESGRAGLTVVDGSLEISGGEIINTSGTGDAGINFMLYKDRLRLVEENKYEPATLTFKAERGKTFRTQGFTKSIVHNCSVAEHTELQVSSLAGSPLRTGDKVPDTLPGNITMQYVGAK